MAVLNDKTKFLLRNLLKGFLWLFVIITAFLFVKTTFAEPFEHWLSAIQGKTLMIYCIYTASEVFFGIIPPEIFMIWATRYENILLFIQIILLLASLSYLAGIIGYLFGRYLHTTLIYRFIRIKYFSRYEKLLNKYGLYLIVVAALTPVPFSAISMLVGSVKYPIIKYLSYSSFRFLRFGVYSYFIWITHAL